MAAIAVPIPVHMSSRIADPRSESLRGGDVTGSRGIARRRRATRSDVEIVSSSRMYFLAHARHASSISSGVICGMDATFIQQQVGS